MRRITALLLAVMLAFVMASCQKDNNDIASADNPSPDALSSLAVSSDAAGSDETVSQAVSGTASGTTSRTVSENKRKTTSQTRRSSQSSTASSNPVPSEPQNTWDSLYKYRKNYNRGNNKKLEGNITVHCFFVNDNNSENWSVLWANWYVTTQIKHALNFLKKEAAKYGKTVNFTPKYYLDASTLNVTTNTEFNKSYSMKYNGIIDIDAGDGSSTFNALEAVASNMGYNAAFNLNASLEYETKTEHIFLIFANKQGRSYSNLPDNTIENFTEHSIIFAYDVNRPPETGIPSGYTSLTIAHEILHCYGAEDFYTPDKRKQLACQYYPNDVMLTIDPPVSGGSIGDLTAFQIGWTDTVPAICDNNDWW